MIWYVLNARGTYRPILRIIYFHAMCDSNETNYDYCRVNKRIKYLCHHGSIYLLRQTLCLWTIRNKSSAVLLGCCPRKTVNYPGLRWFWHCGIFHLFSIIAVYYDLHTMCDGLIKYLLISKSNPKLQMSIKRGSKKRCLESHFPYITFYYTLRQKKLYTVVCQLACCLIPMQTSSKCKN